MTRRHIGRRYFLKGVAAAGLSTGFSQKGTSSGFEIARGMIAGGMQTGIDIDRLSITSGGSGSPLLFIHGFGSSKFTWRYVSRAVQDICKYYAIDLPGSGRSSAPEQFQYTLENLSDVVTDFIVRRDLRNLTLVGASLGGGVALLALLRHPTELASRVSRLCIVDGIAYPQKFPFLVGLLRIPILGPFLVDVVPPETQAHAVLKYCYFDESLITAEQIKEYGSYFRRKEVRDALLKTARLIDVERLSQYPPKLKTIKTPSLLIWGRQDRVVPLEIGQRLSRELDQSQFIVIDQCGHLPQEERPSDVILALRQFIQTAG